MYVVLYPSILGYLELQSYKVITKNPERETILMAFGDETLTYLVEVKTIQTQDVVMVSCTSVQNITTRVPEGN